MVDKVSRFVNAGYYSLLSSSRERRYRVFQWKSPAIYNVTTCHFFLKLSKYDNFNSGLEITCVACQLSLPTHLKTLWTWHRGSNSHFASPAGPSQCAEWDCHSTCSDSTEAPCAACNGRHSPTVPYVIKNNAIFGGSRPAASKQALVVTYRHDSRPIRKAPALLKWSIVLF